MTPRERFRKFLLAMLALVMLGVALLAAAPAAARSAGPIAVDAAGNVYVTGGAGLYMKYIATIKYLPDGTRLWAQTYFANYDHDARYRTPLIKVDKFGNVYVAGIHRDPFGIERCLLLKYSPQGALAWAKTTLLSGAEEPRLVDLAVDPAGNIYLAASGYSLGGFYDFRSFIFKYTPAGTLERTFNSANLPEAAHDFGAAALGADALGNIYLTGRFYNYMHNIFFLTFKLSSTLQKVWARYLGFGTTGAVSNTPRDLAVDASGNVWVLGEVSGGQYSGQFLILQKYNAAGNPAVVAKYNYPGYAWDWAEDITLDANANVYMTGRSAGTADGVIPQNTLVIKADKNCVFQWLKHFYMKDGGPFPVAIAANEIGVVVTGENSNYVTVQYDGNGSIKWVKSYDGGGDDLPSGMVVGKYGNVYVTGISAFINSFKPRQNDLTTIRYNNRGLVLPGWPQRYPVP